MRTLLLTGLSLVAITAIAATAFQGTPPAGPAAPVGGGNISACDDAPGGDPSFELDGPAAAGNITVTSVTVNGITIDSSKYTVTGNGGSSPEVVFHSPDPGAPKGERENDEGETLPADNVCCHGTTTKGDREWEGVIDWD